MGDGQDEIALGDQDPENSLWGTSPDGAETVTPGANEVAALNGPNSAIGDLTFPPSFDGSAQNLFSSVPQVDQMVGSDFSFLPSTSADFSPFLPSSSQDNNDIFAFKSGLDDASNSEGLSFALAPETNGMGDGSLFSSR